MKNFYLFLPNDEYGEKIFVGITDARVKFLKLEKKYKKFLKLYFSYKLSKYINLPFKYIIFEQILNFKNIKDSEENYFIFFDNTPWMIDNRFIETFKNKFPKSKIILYLWNTIDNNFFEKSKKNIFYKIITFDKEDSIKYNFEYYPQVHSKKLLMEYKKNEINTKVIFIGKDKNRLDILNNIYSFLEIMKLKPNYFYIVKDNKKYDKNKYKIEFLYDTPLSYNLVLDKLASTEIILDIVKENQIGLTLRVLEALFLNKKLITNNREIINYKFYNENNIYIMKENEFNILEIKEFIKKKYINLEDNIKEEYDVNAWFNFILKII